jgi:hypothetical protein
MTCFQAAALESLAAAAWAQVIATKLLFEQLVAVDLADAALYLGFRGEAFAALAHRLEKNALSLKSLHMGHLLFSQPNVTNVLARN